MRIAFLALLLPFSLLCSFTNTDKSESLLLTKKDYKLFVGYWQGSLTYLDYQTGEPFTLPADLEVKQIGKTDKYTYASIYPNEPAANGVYTMTFADKADSWDSKKIIAKSKLPNGQLTFTTEVLDKDGNDNLPALIRDTYTIGKTSYTNVQMVQFVGKTEWIKRHEYSYKKIKAPTTPK